MTKITIFGGAGFIGHNLAISLKKKRLQMSINRQLRCK